MKITLKSSIYLLFICNFARFVVTLLDDSVDKPVQKKKNPEWDYEPNVKGFLSPDEWYKGYPNCAGKEQSPINLSTNDTKYDDKLRRIKITYEKSIEDEIYDSSIYDVAWSIHNNGKTVNIELEYGEIETILDYEKYSFQQMHFHWNLSEHAVDGKNYAAELHLVHKSLLVQDKLAVVGFLFQLDNKDNDALKPVIKLLKSIISKNKSEFRKKHLHNFQLGNLIPFEIANYYRYMGSLTMPNCAEGVNWYVIADPILKISRRQIEVFQQLHSDHISELKYNARPLQPVNERVIRRSWDTTFRRRSLGNSSTKLLLSLSLLNYVIMSAIAWFIYH